MGLGREEARRHFLPGAGQAAAAVAQFMGGHEFDHGVDEVVWHLGQGRGDLGVVAHRKHQFAAPVDHGHGDGRYAGCGLRLHDDVERHLLLVGVPQHGQGPLQPLFFGGGEVKRMCRGLRQGQTCECEQRLPHDAPPATLDFAIR